MALENPISVAASDVEPSEAKNVVQACRDERRHTSAYSLTVLASCTQVQHVLFRRQSVVVLPKYIMHSTQNTGRESSPHFGCTIAEVQEHKPPTICTSPCRKVHLATCPISTLIVVF